MFPDAAAETFTTDRLPLVDAVATGDSTELELVDEAGLAAWEGALPTPWRQWAQVNHFRAERHRVLLLPDAGGRVARAVLGLGRVGAGERCSPWWFAALPERLPNGVYNLREAAYCRGTEVAAAFALGVGFGRYRFDRYRPLVGTPREVHFVWPERVDRARIRRLASADALARDLVNTPAEDLSPADLAGVAARVGARFGARLQQWVGDELLAQRCFAIHAVGRAAAVAPRLVELR
jgi:leucyl aminopeptidase